jgi:hypothetical protein
VNEHAREELQEQAREDIQVIADYLDWSYAIHGGYPSEQFHRALIEENRPMPTLAMAREALDRLKETA